MSYVLIELGGKTRRLKYTYNSTCDIEDKANAGIPELLSEKRIGFSTIRLLVWGGLKWENRGITIEAVGNMIEQYIDDGGDIAILMGFVAEALEKSKVLGGKSEGKTETGAAI